MKRDTGFIRGAGAYFISARRRCTPFFSFFNPSFSLSLSLFVLFFTDRQSLDTPYKRWINCFSEESGITVKRMEPRTEKERSVTSAESGEQKRGEESRAEERIWHSFRGIY